MNWIYYLLEANFYLVIFYLLYLAVLRRETYYQFNRAYLLITSLLSFIIPFVQLSFLKPVPLTGDTLVITGTAIPAATKVIIAPANANWGINDYWLAAYLLIVFILFVNLLFKIYNLIRLSRKSNNTKVDSYTLIETRHEPVAFSFFNYLFINPDLANRHTVIHHELIHVRQKHSWDIIYIELLKIANWFNPVVYLLQHSIKELHEFIADEGTAGLEDSPMAYTDFLLNNAYGINGNTITNTFFHKSLLKKRIIMLYQKKSGSLARLKYLLVLPVSIGLLCCSTLSFSKDYGFIDLMPAKGTALKNNPTNKSRKSVVGYLIDPANCNGHKLYNISEKLYKQGYKMDFDEYNDDKNGGPQLKVSIKPLPASGWNETAYASATFRIEELKKIGFIIYVGANYEKKNLYVRSDKRDVKAQHMFDEPKSPFDSLYKYIGKYTRYPAKARANLVAGRVFVHFTITDGKITNPEISRALYPEIDGELLRVIKNFDGPLDPAFTSCDLPVSFTIIDKKGQPIGNPPAATKDKAGIRGTDIPLNSGRPENVKSYILNEVVVVTYL